MCRRTLFAVVGALALAACGDNRDSPPTSPNLQVGTGPACKPTDLKKYAKALFGTNTPGNDIALQLAGQTPNSATATGLAFDLFAAIAAKRDAAPASFTAGNASDGSNLTLQTIACADVAVSGDLTFDAFNAALSAGGGYQVRGVSGDGEATVVSSPVLAGVRPPEGQTFAAWLGSRTLFYGRPITTFSSEVSGGKAYNWAIVYQGRNLPDLTSNPGLVSVCVSSPDPATDATLRVQHVATILPQTTVLSLACLDPPEIVLGRSDRSFVARMMGLLAPAPLSAASLVRTGTPTGNAGSFSPFEAVVPVKSILSFQNQPKDGNVGQSIVATNATGGGPIQVKSTGSGKTPWEGVTIQILGVNNNGNFVAFNNDKALTNASGIATFTGLNVNKTGAYKLVAVTIQIDDQVTNFTSNQVSSAKFNIRP